MRKTALPLTKNGHNKENNDTSADPNKDPG
jgi:hypothetical protein